MVIAIYLALSLISIGAFAQEGKGLAFVDFMSWQQEGSIKTGSTQSDIILTNKATCLGGAYSFHVTSYRTFIDGCMFYGNGNVGSEDNTITYNQSRIALWGAKASLGAGKFVSPSQSEIGLKLPIMYVHQTLTEPAGTSLTQPNPFMIMVSLYSRWPIKNWFVQTEFSKFIGNDQVLYSLGGGSEF